MLEVKPGESVYDPTCGSGGMLVSAAVELRRQGKEHRTLKLYGQERNLTTSAIARMNLFLHGIEDFDVVRGDTLAEPAFIEKDALRRFDVVLANPPYSIKSWDRGAWQSDKWGRNRYGTPPQGRADYAFWQHILASMKPNSGRCAILFPHGVLMRDDEAAMRAGMIHDDVIEAVLGLGRGLFYNAGMESCVVICRSKKPLDRKGKVLFIEAADEVSREHAQSFLNLAHIDRIVGAYREFVDEDGFAAVATLDEIAAKQNNLSIPLYVKRAATSTGNDLKTTIQAWRESSSELKNAAEDLFTLLRTMEDGK
jgi:type I restriction enzyme M protein